MLKVFEGGGQRKHLEPADCAVRRKDAFLLLVVTVLILVNHLSPI